MKIKLFIIINQLLVFTFLISSTSFAGTAPITVVNVKSNIKVVKYEFRYGTDYKDNPSEYTESTIVVLDIPTAGQSTCEVEFEGSGTFYVSVKDYYEDGSESNYSEPFQINNVPDKVTNPAVK